MISNQQRSVINPANEGKIDSANLDKKEDQGILYREVLNQHRWNIHVWIGICNDQIIKSHFFEHTINSPIYLAFL